jgi:DNA-binding SARP family transcriptional activator/uncharacterized protein YkuJ
MNLVISAPKSTLSTTTIEITRVDKPQSQFQPGRRFINETPRVDKPLAVRLLGAPEITWKGRPHAVPRRQTRALLYRLAAGMEPVSRDQLLLLFWPDKADAQARRSLTRLISSLRRALPQPDLLLADTTAVALDPSLASCDAASFFHLVDHADPASLEEAVALVNGLFLDGFALAGSPEFDSWQSMMQGQVEQRYLGALAALVDAKSEAPPASGGPDLAAAVRYANQYLATDELAETIHRRLITLYARRGEREAAMRQFEACVRTLERELGVDPLPETRAAFEAAQRGETDGQPGTAGSLPRPKWHTLPSLDLPLIGREKESRLLAAALESTTGGGIIFISGEPGIGKSRLMQAAAFAQAAPPQVAPPQEGMILLGECRQATQSLPFQPLVEALRLALPWPDFGAGVRPVWLAEAARLLPELRERFPDLPQTSGAAEDQARLFEALIQLFLGLAAQHPLLLCLDDLQWADETTLRWLQVLAPRLSGSALRLLATYRSAEADLLLPLQRALRRLGPVTDVRLGPLSEEAIDAIVDHISAGQAPPNLSGRIYRMTGGNTFFVLELVRDLSEQKLLKNPPQTLPVPQSVLETVQQRVGRLTPLARQLLDAAAILETNLNAGVIQLTTGRSDLEVGDGLDELVQRQLLLPQGAGFRFQHDLVQTAVNQQLTPWRSRLLNRRAGEALEAVFEHDLDAAAAQMAQHFDKAGEVVSAVRNYERAAAFAQRVYANYEAVRYYERAIELLLNDRSADGRQSLIRLYEGLGQVARRQAVYDKAEEAFRSMLATAGELGDRQAAAQALLRLGQVQDSRRHYAASLESAVKAREIAAQVGLDDIYGHALYAHAWSLFRLDQFDKALPIAQEALEHGMEASDRQLMAYSQNTIGAIYKYQGHFRQSDKHQQEALKLFEEIGDTRRVAGMLNNLGETARLRGDYDQALVFYRQAVAIAGQIGERDWLVEFLYNLGLVQIELDQFGEAEQALMQAVDAAEAAGQKEKAAEIRRLLAGLKDED